MYNVCLKSSDPFHIVTYYIKWVTTSWTDGIFTAWAISSWFTDKYKDRLGRSEVADK